MVLYRKMDLKQTCLDYIDNANLRLKLQARFVEESTNIMNDIIQAVDEGQDSKVQILLKDFYKANERRKKRALPVGAITGSIMRQLKDWTEGRP